MSRRGRRCHPRRATRRPRHVRTRLAWCRRARRPPARPRAGAGPARATTARRGRHRGAVASRASRARARPRRAARRSRRRTTPRSRGEEQQPEDHRAQRGGLHGIGCPAGRGRRIEGRGHEQPGRAVEDEPEAARQGQDDESEAQQVRVDPEVRAESGRDTGDDVTVVTARHASRSGDRHGTCSRRLRAGRTVRHGSPRGDIPDGAATRAGARSPHGSVRATRPTGRSATRPGSRPATVGAPASAAFVPRPPTEPAESDAGRRCGGDRPHVRLGRHTRPPRVRRGRAGRNRRPRVRRRVGRDPSRSRRRSRGRAA